MSLKSQNAAKKEKGAHKAAMLPEDKGENQIDNRSSRADRSETKE